MPDTASGYRHHRYLRTQGLQLLEALVGEGKLIFTSADMHAAGAEIGIPEAQVNTIVSRLAAGGWVQRLKRGLYAVTDSAPGGRAPHEFAIATSLVSPSAISGWSALSFHGLTEQVPRDITCITTKGLMTPSMRRGSAPDEGPHRWVTGGLTITYTRVSRQRFFGIEEVWVDAETRVPMTSRERTVLGLFVSSTRVMDFGGAVAVLEEHRGTLDLLQLVRLTLDLRVAAVAKRLGWALEQLGVEPKVIAPLLAVKVKAIQPLDPDRMAHGPVIARWNLQQNLDAPVRR